MWSAMHRESVFHRFEVRPLKVKKKKPANVAPSRPKKAVKPEDIELHPDAWERFERGVKKIAAHTRDGKGSRQP